MSRTSSSLYLSAHCGGKSGTHLGGAATSSSRGGMQPERGHRTSRESAERSAFLVPWNSAASDDTTPLLGAGFFSPFRKPLALR